MDYSQLLSPQTRWIVRKTGKSLQKSFAPLTWIVKKTAQSNIEAVQPAIEQVSSSIWKVTEPIVAPVKEAVQQSRAISQLNTFFSEKWITLDDIKALAEDEGIDPNEVITKFQRNGIKVQGMEELQAQQPQTEQNIQNPNVWTSADNPLFNFVGGVVSGVPKVAWETASFFSNLGAYTPWAVLSAAVRAPFVEETYWQLREQQKQWWEVFSKAWQTGKEFVKKYGAYNPNSTWAKVGEAVTDIGSAFVWPNKWKIVKEWAWLIGKYGAKALNLGQEGAIMWAKYDVATKWEITPEWAGIWAWANILFGGWLWIVKKWYEWVTKRLPASLTLGGLINPQKLDIVKKWLQVDEWVATPEDVGKWILDRVKPWNKQEIADQLIQHAEKTKWAVDEALSSIPNYFKNPEAKKALMQIRNELEWKVGLEWRLAQIDEMIAKPDYTLSELNAVKRELDNMYNLYTKTAEPTAWIKAEWLRNVRSNLRKFIEDEAEKYGVNIRKLNNETATARWLAEGILRKDSSESVRELLTAFAPSGAGAAVWAWQAIARWEDPLTVLRDALIGGIATKVATSTTVRTKIASALNNLVPKELTALENYIRSGGKDAIGKKVAEKVIQEWRALPARTVTKPSDFAKPTEKSIITPQTMEKWIIKESKKGLSPNIKRPNGNTNNTSSNTSGIPVRTKEVQESSSKVTPKWVTKKTEWVKPKPSPQVKPVEKTVKPKNLTPKKESATMGDMETKKLIEEARKYKSAEEFIDSFKWNKEKSFAITESWKFISSEWWTHEVENMRSWKFFEKYWEFAKEKYHTHPSDTDTTWHFFSSDDIANYIDNIAITKKTWIVTPRRVVSIEMKSDLSWTSKQWWIKWFIERQNYLKRNAVKIIKDLENWLSSRDETINKLKNLWFDIKEESVSSFYNKYLK